jgi:hypothetical protein
LQNKRISQQRSKCPRLTIEKLYHRPSGKTVSIDDRKNSRLAIATIQSGKRGTAPNPLSRIRWGRRAGTTLQATSPRKLSPTQGAGRARGGFSALKAFAQSRGVAVAAGDGGGRPGLEWAGLWLAKLCPRTGRLGRSPPETLSDGGQTRTGVLHACRGLTRTAALLLAVLAP